MKTQTYKPKTAPHKLWSFFDKNNIQHRQILSLCIQFRWTKEHPKTGRMVADLGALDRWLRGQSPVKKPLAQMTIQELSKVIYAMEQMIKKYYSK